MLTVPPLPQIQKLELSRDSAELLKTAGSDESYRCCRPRAAVLLRLPASDASFSSIYSQPKFTPNSSSYSFASKESPSGLLRSFQGATCLRREMTRFLPEPGNTAGRAHSQHLAHEHVISQLNTATCIHSASAGVNVPSDRAIGLLPRTTGPSRGAG